MPLLQVRDAVKDFGGVRAVDNCSLDVMRGTITGLIGPNGAGKTTLFNLVSGAIPLSGGRIIFDGEEIHGSKMHQTFARGLMRTFQIPREMKGMTVLENLMVVPAQQTGERLWASWLTPWRVARQERDIEERAMETLEFVRLSHLADEYAGNLSTGQKKLLELARTLMAEPKMVLLDEPAAGSKSDAAGRLGGRHPAGVRRTGCYVPAHRARHGTGGEAVRPGDSYGERVCHRGGDAGRSSERPAGVGSVPGRGDRWPCLKRET